jgi:hypothetical protein
MPGLPIRRRRFLVGSLALGIVVVGGIVAEQSTRPLREPGGHEHCFAEWCVAPQSTETDIQAITVRVRVRSDAKQASQRPDHPQAWLLDATGHKVGGPQPSLDRLLAPGDSYVTNLVFKTSAPEACSMLLVSEGGWPPFLGFGYAPSPFTTQVEWRICEIAG